MQAKPDMLRLISQLSNGIVASRSLNAKVMFGHAANIDFPGKIQLTDYH